MSEQKSLLKNLSNFQDEMKDIEIIKSTEAYGYNYAELEDIIKIILPIMRKHNIGYYHQTLFNETLGKNYVKTVIYNSLDENQMLFSETLVDDKANLAKMNRFMVEGSAITYFRRYQLVAMLGLTTEKDTDAGGMRSKPKTNTSSTSKNSGPAKKTETTIDYVGIFKNLVKNKSEEVANKTFAKYKPQLTNEDIKAIEIVFKEKYGNN